MCSESMRPYSLGRIVGGGELATTAKGRIVMATAFSLSLLRPLSFFLFFLSFFAGIFIDSRAHIPTHSFDISSSSLIRAFDCLLNRRFLLNFIISSFLIRLTIKPRLGFQRFLRFYIFLFCSHDELIPLNSSSLNRKKWDQRVTRGPANYFDRVEKGPRGDEREEEEAEYRQLRGFVCVCDVTRGVATSVKRSCPLMRCDDDDDFSRKRRHKELETTGKKNNPKEREKERREEAEEEKKPRVYMWHHGHKGTRSIR